MFKKNILIKVGFQVKTNILHRQQKNDFESTNFEMFEEVVHSFGKSDDDMV